MQMRTAEHDQVATPVHMPAQTFTYTARRRAYFSAAMPFLAIVALESPLTVLLILVFARAPLVRLLLLGAYAGLLLFLVFGVLLSALWTKHRLTPTHLALRYGLDRIEVPRSAIVAARATHEQLDALQLLRAQLDARRHRIVAAFSEEGQVLLTLDQRRTFRVRGTTGVADQILINVDRRDAFLAALGIPQTCASEPKPASVPVESARPARQDTVPRSPNPAQATAGATPAVRTEHLSRHFGSVTAVDDLNLTLSPGEIYGFLGPNGAGKTTTIKMLVGLLQPDRGHAYIAGHDVWAEPVRAKAAFGYVPDRAVLYDRLTGREFLAFLAQMRAMLRRQAETRIAELLQLLDLAERADTLCSTYSFGMKRKLALAGALLHHPPVLILDEPLNGLDPRSSRCIKNLFADLAAAGTTILLSTHDLATAESVCTRVGILHRGRMVAEGSAGDLRQLAGAPDLETVFLALTEEEPGEVAWGISGKNRP
jgi:ABC-2 type transport system ATP-binding protein